MGCKCAKCGKPKDCGEELCPECLIKELNKEVKNNG